MARAAHPEAMAPSRPGSTRTAAPRMPRQFPFSGRYAAYTLFDAGIAIPLTLGRLAGRLEVALTNLFDESAALLVDYPLPGRGWSTRLRIGAAR